MSKTILIVDDEFLNLKLLDIRLSKKGFTVWGALNGKIAYDKVKEYYKEIDLIITDFTMPIMNGADLIEAVKEEFSRIPIFMASAYDKEFSSSGEDEWFNKPIDYESLFYSIDVYL